MARGTECRAVIVQCWQMGSSNAAGLPIYAVSLTVMPQHGSPYPTQIGTPVEPAALALLFPGSHVPAKVLPEDPGSVVIDWGRALSVA